MKFIMFFFISMIAGMILGAIASLIAKGLGLM